MAQNVTAEDQSAFKALCKRPYDAQAKQFINAFWEKGISFKSNPDMCEKVWTYWELCAKLDAKKGKQGNALDEFEAHKFLEKEGQAMTVKDLRESLKAMDLDFDRHMALLEYLVFHFKIDNWVYMVNWVAAGSPEQQAMLAQVQEQMATAQASLAKATETAETAKEDAAASARAAEEAKAAAEDLAKAAAEADAATKELEAQQKAKADAIAAEEVKTRDETLSTVKRNKAIAYLKILQNEDSQPLRTAQITQAAAARKAAKVAKQSEKAAQAAAAAKIKADEAAATAEHAMEDADAQVAKLSEQLEEAKAACAGSGSDEGTFWWLDREFEESLKYMGPKQKDKALKARAEAKAKAGN